MATSIFQWYFVARGTRETHVDELMNISCVYCVRVCASVDVMGNCALAALAGSELISYLLLAESRCAVQTNRMPLLTAVRHTHTLAKW